MTVQMTGRWEAIGGRQGGTVSALAYSPAYSDDRTIFAATLAGVHRSTDAGLTWQNASQGLPNPFVDAIAFSPDFARDRIVFVGGREAGVSRSTDGGETWQALSFWSPTPPSIAALIVSPAFSQDATVYAGAEDGRVYRTTNAGRSWDAIGTGLPEAAVLSLAIAQGYAGTVSLFAGTTEGLYRSDDGGETWESANLNGLVVQAIALSPSFEMDGTLYVGTENVGVLRSTNGGANWIPMNTGLTDRCINGLALSPGFMIDAIALAATAGGLFRTEDGGESWTAVAEEAGSVLCVAVPPPPTGPDFDLDTLRVTVAGTAQSGVLRSPDAGQSWAAANDGLAARLLVTLAISPDFAADGLLFSCGLEDGVQRGADGGGSWTTINEGLASLEVAGLAISPAFARDRVIVAATAAGVAKSHDGGDHWVAIGGPAPAQAVALALTFDGIGPLLAAGPRGDVHLSPDGGLTWRPLVTPFAGEEVAAVAFSPNYVNDATLFVATSRAEAVGVAGRTTVWWSTDDGQTWEAAMEERGQHRWLSLAIPPTFIGDGAFYIGLADRVLRPMRRAVESRLSVRRPVWIGERPGGPRTTIVGLALSPAYATDQTLVAATSTGVYCSRNAGLSWHVLREGLTDRSIVGVAVSPDYPRDRLIFAASLGGTIWRLRDG